MSLFAEFDILASVKNWKSTRFDNTTLWTCDHLGYYLISNGIDDINRKVTFITPSVYCIKDIGNSTLIINGKYYIKNSKIKNHSKSKEFTIEKSMTSEYDFYVTNNDKKYNLGYCTMYNGDKRCFGVCYDKINYW